MKEVVSIGDPKKFISNSDEHVIFLEPRKLYKKIWFSTELLNSWYAALVKTHEAYFICKAWIVEVLQQNVGLSFLALAAAGSLTNLVPLSVATIVLISTSPEL